MRHILYTIKTWYFATFRYPVLKINPDSSFDYDVYWKEKRGKQIGDLSTWQKDRADFILQVLKSKREGKVSLADVGCGDGSILQYLKTQFSQVVSSIGYDSSAFALAQASASGIETVQVDITKIDASLVFREADYYLLLETLEHVPHSEMLLIEALKKSKKGVFFSFPNTGYIRHRLRFVFGKFPLQWRIMPNEHVRFWTLADVKWWLKALDFHTYEIHYYKGVPILNTIFPGLFAAGFVVYIEKQDGQNSK